VSCRLECTGRSLARGKDPDVTYCPNCGTELDHHEVGDRLRSSCPSCEYVDRGSFTMGVGGLVVLEGKVLLAKRVIPPVGVWTIPGGYVESDETLEAAVLREIKEETGVTAIVGSLVSVRSVVHSSHVDTYVVFRLDYGEGEAIADGVETSEVAWFAPGQLDQVERLTPFSKLLIENTLGGSNGLHRVQYTRPDGRIADCFLVPSVSS
jgi:ADP-ribose pyrophosphatase YjhB (NUDIX family)